MWQKIRSMWTYAYDHFIDQFDYFHICGDDVFMIIDNLRAYLASDEMRRLEDGHLDLFHRFHVQNPPYALAAKQTAEMRPRPLLLGMPSWHKPHTGTYPAGDSGYTLNPLNRAALQLSADRGMDTFRHNYTDSREDIFVGEFFASQGVWTTDTRDTAGAWRYGGNGDADGNFRFRGSLSPLRPKLLIRRYGKENSMKAGLVGVSSQFVSFHLKQGGKKGHAHTVTDLIYRYHQILYRDDDCDDDGT